MKTFVLSLCVFYYLIPSAILSDEMIEAEDRIEQVKKKPQAQDPMKDKQYKAEIANGDQADLFSTNIHQMVPSNFEDYGRRFVVEYPYSEKPSSQIDDEAEENFDKIIKKALKEAEQDNDDEENNLRPVKASPHIVLAVAKQSALLQKAKPIKQPDEVLVENMLRNGDYWNDVWKEDVPDPGLNLRSGKKLESVRVKVMPGSKLYKLVSMTRDLSPKLLYVINSKDDE